MDEEIRDWIQKKKKEAEELKKSEGMEEKIIPSSPEKLPAETQSAEEKTSEPIKTEIQSVEQKTVVKTTQPVSLKISEAAVPSDYEPEEITEEEQDQYPPSQANLGTAKTEYPSKPPLLTKKSKILLVLIAIFVPVFLFIYFYFIPKILK